MRKLRTSSVKSSSTLFSCSIHAMYNKFNCSQKQRLVLKSYLPGINTSIFPKRHDDNIFSEKQSMNYMPGQKITLIYYIPKCIRLIICQIDGTLVNKHKHLLQISVQELHNDITLPISQGCFFGARTEDGKICILDTSLRENMQNI